MLFCEAQKIRKKRQKSGERREMRVKKQRSFWEQFCLARKQRECYPCCRSTFSYAIWFPLRIAASSTATLSTYAAFSLSFRFVMLRSLYFLCCNVLTLSKINLFLIGGVGFLAYQSRSHLVVVSCPFFLRSIWLMRPVILPTRMSFQSIFSSVSHSELCCYQRSDLEASRFNSLTSCSRMFMLGGLQRVEF